MRTKSRARSIVILTTVAIIGAVAWGVIALVRDEQISAAWLIAAALGSYAIAYRFYARFIAKTVLGTDRTRATPADPRARPMPARCRSSRNRPGAAHPAAVPGSDRPC